MHYCTTNIYQPSYRGFHKWGYPQPSSISRLDFPANTIHFGGTPMYGDHPRVCQKPDRSILDPSSSKCNRQPGRASCCRSHWAWMLNTLTLRSMPSCGCSSCLDTLLHQANQFHWIFGFVQRVNMAVSSLCRGLCPTRFWNSQLYLLDGATAPGLSITQVELPLITPAGPGLKDVAAVE